MFSSKADLQQRAALLGEVVDPKIVVACSFITFFIPITVQIVLLLRLLAVYPLRSLSRTKMALIYLPFTLGIMGRCAMASIIWWKMISALDASATAFGLWLVTWTLRYPKAEWALQLFCDA